MDVDFDLDVASIAQVTANWFVRWDGFSRGIANVQQPPSRNIRLNLNTFAANPGPNVVSYSTPPFDIVMFFVPGTPVTAFDDFPLTAA